MNKKVLIAILAIILIAGGAFYYSSGSSLQGKFSTGSLKSTSSAPSLKSTITSGPVDLYVESTTFSYSSIVLQPTVCITGVLSSTANVTLAYKVYQNGQTIANSVDSVAASKLTNNSCTVVNIDALSWGSGLTGQMTAAVSVDSTGRITETDESNNTTTNDFTVVAS